MIVSKIVLSWETKYIHFVEFPIVCVTWILIVHARVYIAHAACISHNMSVNLINRRYIAKDNHH